jgi:hypothetical protein
MPQRELDVFRFVVLDDEPDVAGAPGATRSATLAASLIVRTLATLRMGVGAARSSLAELASAIRRAVLAPTALRALGVFASLALVVLCVVVALRYERARPRAATPAAPSGRSPNPAAAPSRATKIHIQATALIETAVDRTATASPPFNGYLYDLPRSAAFARSWRFALSNLPADVSAGNAWLVRLETTAAPNEAIETRSGERYILAWGCDPSDCARRSVQLAYNASTGAVAATLYDGAWHTFGSTVIDDRATLLAQIACERLGPGKRIPLRANDAANAERFIASTSFE